MPGISSAFSNQEDLGQWLTFYYKRPEPNRVAEALVSASKYESFRSGEAVAPFIGFVAGVLGKNPGLAPSLTRLSDLPETGQYVIVLGVWHSGLKDARRLLGDLAKSMPSQKRTIEGYLAGGPAPRLIELPLDKGPWVLDALWGLFMATGDAAPVIRTMSALPWVDADAHSPMKALGVAAKRALTANAAQHPRVLEICKAQLALQPKDVAAVLAQVISDAAKTAR